MKAEKFRVTFKTPDALDEPTREAGTEMARQRSGNDDENACYWAASLREFASKWVKYGEYVTIEFDYNMGTATVVPSGG